VNLETLLSQFTHHVESIIQWIVLIILLLGGLLVYTWMSGKKASKENDGVANSDLKAAIDKIMEQTAKLESVALQDLKPADAAQVDAQVQQLKKDLQAKESELSALKAGGASSGVTEDAAKLAERIKELEGKLSEYEILEDDIADLSLYKEENQRLRAELDKAKGGSADAAAAGDAAPGDAAAAAGEQIVDEFKQAVESEPVSEASSDLSVPDTGNPMADFESTVELEKKLSGQKPEEETALPANPPPASEAPPVEDPAPSAEPPAPKAQPQAEAQKQAASAEPAPVESVKKEPEAGDLFTEFEHSPVDAGATLDTEKMMAEMEALVSVEPTEGNALEESIDMEKMAKEANKS
jgi:hypothetical protein